MLLLNAFLGESQGRQSRLHRSGKERQAISVCDWHDPRCSKSAMGKVAEGTKE
jgi:hypothetical protein